MRSDYILEGETLSRLSARLRVPACALMRANGLFSPAWLLPGREIIVPEGACGGDFPCPREVFCRPVQADECIEIESIERLDDLARRLNVPERLLLLAAGRRAGELPLGTRLKLPPLTKRRRIIVAGVFDTAESLAEKYHIDETELRRDNRLDGCVYPGMALLISGGE